MLDDFEREEQQCVGTLAARALIIHRGRPSVPVSE
jgi:hypothetical protein